jgi:hypothetical protein
MQLFLYTLMNASFTQHFNYQGKQGRYAESGIAEDQQIFCGCREEKIPIRSTTLVHSTTLHNPGYPVT